MSRFKTSKYRNAFPHIYKKENWIHDLNVGSNLKYNNCHVKASCDYVAFIHDSSSVGSVGLLPIGSHGRNTNFPLISGHSGVVTDFDFSPFHDSVLATAAEDGVIKVWQIPEGGVSPEVPPTGTGLAPVGVPIESIHFHPAADNVLGGSTGNTVKVWDLNKKEEKYSLSGHENVVQSFCWHGNGSLLATICKGNARQKVVRVFDPRAGTTICETPCHSLQKDSQVVWLGDSDYFVTSGADMSRCGELALWNTSDLSKPVKKLSLENVSGVPMVFYDEDTKMLYVGAKGESSIRFYEFTESGDYFRQGPNMYQGQVQQKGLCMVPKRAVDVMSCQIARFMLLSQNSIIPVGFHVQRKSMNEFHADLFPDTAGPDPAMTADEWFSGENKKVAMVSLDPSKRRSMERKTTSPTAKPSTQSSSPSTTQSSAATNEAPSTSSSRKSPSSNKVTQHTDEIDAAPAAKPAPPAKVLNIVRSSKVRHVEGQTLHKSTFIDHLPTISTTVPGDSDAFAANTDRCAVALSIAGGQIGVFELSKPGRLDRDDIPTLQNVAGVMDFVFDPFNNNRLVVACDDARIKIWNIPDGGLKETCTEPQFSLVGHYEKPNVLCYHPLASGLLASAGYDCHIYLWNVENRSIAIKFDPLPEPLFAMSWSPSGKSLATLAKDHVIRIYDPRESTKPVKEGVGPEGSRGARILWIDENTLIISGFGKGSSRELSLYSLEDLSAPKQTLEIDVCPATLIPHYDPDVHLLYLSGKGDSTIMTIEYVEDTAPYLFQGSSFGCGKAHQAVTYLPKTLCDVKKVEVARGLRLCKTSVEPLIFRIPRVKLEYFQDDLYPRTRVFWKPVLTADEWLAGENKNPETLNLRPADMKPLSEAPKAAPVRKKYEYDVKIKSDQEKKDELISAMITKMGDKDEDALPQDQVEGVDSDEWDDY